MKTLFLLRHAKAANAPAGMDDADRPLNEIGREACARVGLYIKKQHIIPEIPVFLLHRASHP